ncbi:RraA family protein [Cronobacter sakazakii]|uniref:RraA family protein n=1 Tax=Cronobacter sakazakii TaxID=28141 RepID=UPI000BE97BFE|nr:dimethylmenaquinone methyltransferase [Cronobacter sakazakii]PUV27926.1 dimethylmenaquinone methyltransferase [Cronobacter sakazakii]
MRLGVAVRCAPSGIRPVWSHTHLVGRVSPVRHFGSVDVFLEAIDRAAPGDVLVVDNAGRLDEACVGDLITLETCRAGLAGIVIWGLHRDTNELRTIRLPFFSLGALPAGPQRLDEVTEDVMSSAYVGAHFVTAEDFVLADDDGVLFIPLSQAEAVADLAITIRDTERQQAARMLAGMSFREQARFGDYMAERKVNPDLTFRQYLRAFGGAIEE